MSQFLVKVFAILDLTWLNLVYFSVNSSVIFTWSIYAWFTLNKEWLVLNNEWFKHTKGP